MIPPNEETPPPVDYVKRNAETKEGALTAAFAVLGFIAFWVVGSVLMNATRWKFFVGYLVATSLIGFGLLIYPRLKGFGIGILLGLLLAGGLYLLLLAMCGHMSV